MSSRPVQDRDLGWTGYLIGPVFLALAAWMVWSPGGLDLPESEASTVDLSQLATAPRRESLTHPPMVNVDGFDRTCQDCHQMFPPRPDPPVELLQHKHVVLVHGINDRCRNCHYEKDRNMLVLRGGEVITYDQVVELCAKCHGPTYRDWQRGAHGRTNGYWDAMQGEVKRLTCTECHDPHNPRVPAMDPMAPLPGPNTLRMGSEPEVDHTATSGNRDPLWLRSGRDDSSGMDDY